MRFPRASLCLALAPMLASCSSSTNHPAPGHDASGGDHLFSSPDAGLESAPPPQDSWTAGDLRADVSLDAGLETASLPPDSSTTGDLGTDGARDAGLESAQLPLDSSTTGDLAADARTDDAAKPDAGDAEPGTTCIWQNTLSGRYQLEHFSFLLTTPDGQEQTPPSGRPGQDAGSPQINDFEGRIVSVAGNRFSVDSCLSSACQPSLYQFALCSSLESACRFDDSQSSIEMAIPSGRHVRVVWQISMDVPSFSPGLYSLAIYDSEPGATKGNLLFLGSGGNKPSSSGDSKIGPIALPFTVALHPLNCRDTTRDAFVPPDADDYAFVFKSAGAALPLQLATGETGTLGIFTDVRPPQQLQVHCLDAVQPAGTDDYWNWDFWAVAVVAPPPADAGGN